MKNLVFRVLLILAVLALAVKIDEVHSERNDVIVKEGSIIFNGIVNTSNVQKIEYLYNKTLKKNINYLVLQSPGGDLADGIELAKFVMNNDIPVYVSSSCSSACTFAFFSAKHKDMAPDAIIGIHNLSVEPSIDMTQFSMQEVQLLSRKIATNAAGMFILYANAGIPLSVLSEASTKFGANAINLTRNDLVSYNILPKQAVFRTKSKRR